MILEDNTHSFGNHGYTRRTLEGNVSTRTNIVSMPKLGAVRLSHFCISDFFCEAIFAAIKHARRFHKFDRLPVKLNPCHFCVFSHFKQQLEILSRLNLKKIMVPSRTDFRIAHNALNVVLYVKRRIWNKINSFKSLI